MTPRITGFSNLRGRFSTRPFNGAIAVRVEERSLKELWVNPPASALEKESLEKWLHKREVWFMFKDMVQ